MRLPRLKSLCYWINALFISANILMAEPYRVQTGDILRMRIIGVPQLDSDGAVMRDGTVAFPLVGQIMATGQTTDDISIAVEQRLLNARFTAISSTQPSQTIDLAGFQTFIEVAQFRPIYLDGFITHPGEASFHPGLTIRAAIVRAGGLRQSDDPAAQTDITALQIKHWRLDALAAGNAAHPAPLYSDDWAISLQQAAKTRVENELATLAQDRQIIIDKISAQTQILALYDDLISTSKEAASNSDSGVSRVEYLNMRGLARGRDVVDAQRVKSITHADHIKLEVEQNTIQQTLAGLEQQLLQLHRTFDQNIAIEREEVTLALAQSTSASRQNITLDTAHVMLFRDGAKIQLGTQITLDSAIAPGDIITVTAPNRSGGPNAPN